MYRLCWILVALCAFTTSASTTAANPTTQGEARPNPFKPRELKAAKKRTSHGHGSFARVTEHPRLRGVLRAPEGSMANLDGHILAVQESALGYRLLAVDEHSAEFYHRGQRIRLYVGQSIENEIP